MKRRFGIGDRIPEIQETDIPKLAHYADKEANPLYPVPVLMNAAELEPFYYMLMNGPKEAEDFQDASEEAGDNAADTAKPDFEETVKEKGGAQHDRAGN